MNFLSGNYQCGENMGHSPIALIFNPMFFIQKSNEFGIFSHEVIYEKMNENTTLEKFCKKAIDNIDMFPAESRKHVQFWITECLKNFTFTFKHQAFGEEEEWRAVYRPSESKKPILKSEIVTIDGLTQVVFKFPFCEEKDSLMNMLQTIIIGPTRNPQLVADAVYRKLSRVVPQEKAEGMIELSNIPYRG